MISRKSRAEFALAAAIYGEPSGRSRTGSAKCKGRAQRGPSWRL